MEPNVNSKQLFISVIIPVHNSAEYLGKCLDALAASSYKSYEIIVVDDASTDNSFEIGRKKGVVVHELPRKSGAAAARNYGAKKAKGDIFLFVDSDVVVRRDTVAQVAHDFMKNPDIAAVFGSYDDSPADSGFISQFRNLLHHYIHQVSLKEAMTFWTGCGAIKREVFYQVREFDESWYAMEDVEIGFRMWKSGYRIVLDKELQVKHLKHWGLYSLVRTDVFYRAVPWSRLIFESGFLPSDLNLQTSHRISGVLVGFLFLVLALLNLSALGFFNIVANGVLLIAVLSLVFTLIILNRKVYGFFLRKRGIKFMLLSIPLHFFYYFYSGTTFVACWTIHRFPSFQSGLKKLGFGLLKR
ncbi:MAG TPA: glycosyltransferase family 2 protein [Thermodesulfobacteriota bacterium]|nr:glycosyltransferase family 2 protein [Thermodesulfobacteriota bacterium]